MTAVEKFEWQQICERHDLVPGSGVCALVEGEQVALFYLKFLLPYPVARLLFQNTAFHTHPLSFLN